MLQRGKWGITAESSWRLTISLLNYSPVSPLRLACLLQYKAEHIPANCDPLAATLFAPFFGSMANIWLPMSWFGNDRCWQPLALTGHCTNNAPA